jgi:hypothetical protein
MTPAMGDKYVLVDITMPLSYVVTAESELKSRALQELDKLYADKPAYSVDCNAFWFRQNEQIVKLGYVVTLDIPDMEINRNIRIIGYTRNLRNRNLYTLELADTAKQTMIVKLINGI